LSLPLGKIPAEILAKNVYGYLGLSRKDVILGPSLGEDGALVKIGNKVLVSSMDPISGALDKIGWLSVNINANDVATFGIRPSFFSSCILLPRNSDEKLVQNICYQINKAAKKLGIAVIGGHSEITPDLYRPVVVGCAMGITDPNSFVTSHGSKPGDLIILTKSAGIEGTAILATEKRRLLEKSLSEEALNSAAKFYNKISIVDEAVLAFKTGGVTAMHDPTEGGIIGGIHEMADASSLGVKIFKENIFVSSETEKICSFFHIDPLHLISSGALIIASKAKSAKKIIKNLSKHNIKASIIGEFLDDPAERVLFKSNNKSIKLVRPISDQIWSALEYKNK
jgi:hydrogenase maturation factor